MELTEELAMTYNDYVAYLLKKYGVAKYDYFCTPSCKSKNSKTSRMLEGLFCHHIAENKEILLSTPEVARTQPFEYQKADWLVYCNYLEHLLLHIKIVEEDKEGRGLGVGGVIMISSVMNDYFRHKKANGWRRYAMEQIKDRYDDYIIILKYFQSFVYKHVELKRLLPSPILAQGWYGIINREVYKDVYGYYPTTNSQLSNTKFEYLDQLCKN